MDVIPVAEPALALTASLVEPGLACRGRGPCGSSRPRREGGPGTVIARTTGTAWAGQDGAWPPPCGGSETRLQ